MAARTLRTGTELGDGFARHGFEALAALDGDGDGKLTSADPAWPNLRLWADADGDRRSRPQELSTLNEAGLTELDLGFSRDFECTAGGNCEGEHAPASLADGGSARIIDVYLRCR